MVAASARSSIGMRSVRATVPEPTGVAWVVMAAASWWLAGRSIQPAQLAWRRQQSFVANASHELRTPLTLLRATAEVAQRSLGPDETDRRVLLGDILAECDHMSRLVGDLLLLSRLDHTTDLMVAGVSMLVLGLGLGAVNQNLVLAVQNSAAQRDMGAASSLAAFFRTMGGSIGVSALGAALAHQVASSVTAGLARLGIAVGEGEGGTIPDLGSLPAPVREVFEAAYGDATGHVFLLAVPFAVVALICILFIREVPLRTTIARADELAEEPAASR